MNQEWEREKNLNIEEYERRILEEGVCGGLLSMSFIEKDGARFVCFDKGNLVPFSQYCESRGKIMNASRMLAFLRSIAEGLQNVDNHLLSPARVSLTPETVYISPVTGEAKLTYDIWAESREVSEGAVENKPDDADDSINRRFQRFLSQTVELLRDPEWTSYAERLKRDIEEINPDLRELVRRAGEMEREAEKLKWPLPSVARESFWEEESCREEGVGYLEYKDKGSAAVSQIFQRIKSFMMWG